MAQTGKFHILLEELKRRRVFRVATLYVVATWPIIQIADILSPALNLPDGAMRTLLMLFIVGFPIVIALSWIYNLTPKGLMKIHTSDDGNIEQADERLIGKKTELLIIGLLIATAVGLFFLQGPLIGSGNNANSAGTLASEEYKFESIAVLPFVPFSEDKQDEYFADGLTEEILNVLAKIQSLRVVARTSSFAYKGVNRNIQEVGAELGVDAILEGSVRRNDIDNTIRVTAQLIDIRTGTHLWSETYDRKFTDVFKIQDEITEAVVSELKITLLGDERKQLLAHDSANTDAMVAYSRGRTELAKRTSASVIEAEQYFSQAVFEDPGYATAYASLAEANTLLILYSGKPRKEYLAKAQVAADTALRLDPNLGLAWAAQGLILMSTENKIDEARAALEKALELNPSYAMANMWYGSLLDDNEKMMEYHRKALLLDPKSPVAGYNVASNLIKLGRDKEAMEVFSQIVGADPFYPGAYNLVAMINQYSGRVDQAIIQYKKSYELGESKKIAIEIAKLYLDLGDLLNAKEWVAIVKEGASEDILYSLGWIDVWTLLLEGNRQEAETVLTQLKTVENPNMWQYYNSSKANYWLTDYPETIAQFEKAEAYRAENKTMPMKKSGMGAYIMASYAYQQLEQLDKSNELLRLIKLEQDNIITSDVRVTANLWYEKSLVQAIEGDHQLALITLQRAIDEGWTQPLRTKEEPILKALKDDINFKSMMAGLETRMNLMREQLVVEESFSNHWKS
jgi:TolB-like protein/Flp pilus assembly protein TadD